MYMTFLIVILIIVYCLSQMKPKTRRKMHTFAGNVAENFWNWGSSWRTNVPVRVPSDRRRPNKRTANQVPFIYIPI